MSADQKTPSPPRSAPESGKSVARESPDKNSSAKKQSVKKHVAKTPSARRKAPAKKADPITKDSALKSKASTQHAEQKASTPESEVLRTAPGNLATKKTSTGSTRKDSPDARLPLGISKGELLKSLKSMLDLESGGERVALFAARNALRVFPLGVEQRLADDKSWEGMTAIFWLAAVWRALLDAWSPEEGARKSNSLTTTRALDAIAANNEHTFAKITAESAQAAAIDFLAKADQDENLSAVAKATEDSVIVESNAAAALSDIEFLLHPDNIPASLRASPLWPEKQFADYVEQPAWHGYIDRWIERHQEAGNPDDVKLLHKIRNDYQAILNGSWQGEPPGGDGQPDDAAHNDKPSLIDHLGRDRLVEALLPRLSKADDKDPLTVGLLGDWGIGKSSVIEQIKGRLKNIDHTEYLFGMFNAWSYEHTQSMQAGVAQEITNALTSAPDFLPAAQKWFYKLRVRFKYAAKLHGQRILTSLLIILAVIIAGQNVDLTSLMPNELAEFANNFLGLGLGVMGLLIWLLKDWKTISSLPLAQELNTYLRLPSFQQELGEIPVMQENVSALCKICLGKNPSWKKYRRLVFFIDDLDRCSYDGIVKTFEAVRLVLDVNNVIVVIAMDQRIALPALACHYEKLSKFHQRDPLSIARDYLAKVIHIPIQLQVPGNKDIADYLADLWGDPGFADQTPLVQESLNDQTQRLEDETDSSSEPAGVTQEKSTEKNSSESIQDIERDINKIDIASYLNPSDPATPPPGNPGFGTKQKEAFYLGLIYFNLRNPRQIKRLYNAYNLLWSVYDDHWDGDDWRVYMLAMFALEMINEFVPLGEKREEREKYLKAYFSAEKKSDLTYPEHTFKPELDAAKELILEHQRVKQVNLRELIEPFVLPAVKNIEHYQIDDLAVENPSRAQDDLPIT